MLVLGSVFNKISNILFIQRRKQKKSSAKKVASYQLSEDRAAMALAWDAPPDAVGADTVTLAKIGGRMGMMEVMEVVKFDSNWELLYPKLDWWKVRKSSPKYLHDNLPRWMEGSQTFQLQRFKRSSRSCRMIRTGEIVACKMNRENPDHFWYM